MTPASHQKYTLPSYSLSLGVLQLFQWILLNHSSQINHLRFVNILQILVFPNKIINLIKFNHQYGKKFFKKHTHKSNNIGTHRPKLVNLSSHVSKFTAFVNTHIRVWLIYFLIITVRLSVCSATCFPRPHPCNIFF